MKNNLSCTVRMVSPMDVNEVRSRIRLAFMPGDPCYSGKVEENSFLLESTEGKLFGAKWSFANVSRISVCPDLHISLNPVDSGTIIGVHAAPNPLSDVSVFRFFPIMWLVIAISSLLADGSFVTILLLCATPLVILYWWLISRKVKHYYTAGTERILKRLAAILQATLEDVPLNETRHG